MISHVCLVGIDGLRIRDARAGSEMTVLNGFIDNGAYAEMEMEVPTISGPGWSSILTGASHAEHGVRDNTYWGHHLLDYPDFLSQAWFADQRMTTWAGVSWLPLADPRGPAPIIWWRDEAQRAGRHAITLRDGETYGYREADGQVLAWAQAAIAGAGPRASFIYFGEVDLAGHVYGGVSEEYREAMSRVDERFAGVLSSIRHRVSEHPDEQWLLAVTTDHGHLDEGGHGGADPVLRRSFLAADWITAAGHDTPRLPSPCAPTEVAPFLLAALGVGSPDAGSTLNV